MQAIVVECRISQHPCHTFSILIVGSYYTHTYNVYVAESEKNRSYLHKIHLFILSYLSPFLSFIEFLSVYDEIYDKVLRMLGKRVNKFARLKTTSNFTCR